MKVRIRINGEPKQIAPDTPLATLLKVLCEDDEGVAVAVNQQIISRDHWHATALSDGDELTVFRAIAGG